MKIAFCIFAVLCLINISMVFSQGLFSTKKCADFVLVPMEHFKKNLYIGSWFVHQMYDFPGSKRYDCYVVIATLYPNGSVNVTELLLRPGVLPEIRSEGVSTASPDGKGIFTYVNPAEPAYQGEYYILGTDYLTYAIEVACRDVRGGSRTQLYIKSSTPVVLPFTQKKIDKIITATKLDKTKIRTLDITTCPSTLIKGSGLLGGLLKLLSNVLNELVGGLLG